jgi:hypothetical protein
VGEVIGPRPETYTSSSFNFDVRIINCPTTVIQPSVITDKYYVVGSVTLTITFPDWTETEIYCGPFTYSFNSLPSNSIISYNTLARQIMVTSFDFNDVGAYTITITGQISNGLTTTRSFVLHVEKALNNAPYFVSNL